VNTAELVDLIAKRKGSVDYTIPNPKSSPKEIVGHHGHRPAGKSILWPALYRHLRAKGYTKAKAAAISNAQWNRKHGVGAKNATSTRVTKSASALRYRIHDIVELRSKEQVRKLDARSVVARMAHNHAVGDGAVGSRPDNTVATKRRLLDGAPNARVSRSSKSASPDKTSVRSAGTLGDQLVVRTDTSHLRAASGSGISSGSRGGSHTDKRTRSGNKSHALVSKMNYGSADAADRSLTRTQRPGAAPRAAAPAAQGAAPQQQQQKKKGKRKRKTNRTLSGKEVQQRRNAARGRRKQQNEDQEKTKKFYDAFNQLDPKLQDIARKLFTAANSGGEMKLKDRDEEIMFQMALEQNGVKHTKNTVTIGDKKIKYGVG
jgi:hypothetical protein